MRFFKTPEQKRIDNLRELAILKAKAVAAHRLMDAGIPFSNDMSYAYVDLMGEIMKIEVELT